MTQKLERPSVKITIRVFEDDLEYLKMTYTGTGYNGIFRALGARHVRKLRARTIEHLAESETLTREELSSV